MNNNPEHMHVQVNNFTIQMHLWPLNWAFQPCFASQVKVRLLQQTAGWVSEFSVWLRRASGPHRLWTCSEYISSLCFYVNKWARLWVRISCHTGRMKQVFTVKVIDCRLVLQLLYVSVRSEHFQSWKEKLYSLSPCSNWILQTPLILVNCNVYLEDWN